MEELEIEAEQGLQSQATDDGLSGESGDPEALETDDDEELKALGIDTEESESESGLTFLRQFLTIA